MIEQALKSAIIPSFAVVAGGLVLPRFMRPEEFVDPWAGFLPQFITYFATIYFVCFVVDLFILQIKEKRK